MTQQVTSTAARKRTRVRALADGDDGAVRALFLATLALGGPLPFPVNDLDLYQNLSLAWYLGAGRQDAAVLEIDGEVRGYVLVCTDEQAFRRWGLPRGLAWGARTLGGLANGRHRGPAATFLRLRVVDGLAAGLDRRPAPFGVHMHFNVARGTRTVDAGLRLAQHVDDLCRARGLPGWYGEINAQAGRRAVALERLGGRVEHAVRNRTLTWLAGRPVDRLTVSRRVDGEDYRPLVRRER